MKKLNNLIAIIGPTATGKSDLAIELALEFGSEIISADSRLIFKDFNIGTAKPSNHDLQKVKHHCIDIVLPTDDFSVTDYKNIANNAIYNLFDKNKTPVLAGGTGFYIKSLLEGFEIPHVPANEIFRAEMRSYADDKGNEALFEILKSKDKVTAEKLHYNDVFRVIRALEVIHTLNKPMSEIQTKSTPDYNIIYIFLDAKDRNHLYERINQRVDIMLDMGLVNEVKNLIHKYGKTISMLKTLGYKEVIGYLDDEITYDEMKELIKKNTRNFAKRQLTWFRAIENTSKFYIDEFDKTEILAKVKEKCLNMML